jgi:dihydrofolate reductase
MKYNIIVAMCKNNNGIGINGQLPWNIKEDLRYFSKLTRGDGNNAIIMGSNTYKSINKNGLGERDNFILSSTLNINLTISNGKHIVKTFTNIDSILETCSANNYDIVWIIGGDSIYKQFLHREIIDKCYVTLIHKLFKCDTIFPLLDVDKWSIEHKTDNLINKDKYDFKIEFIEYKHIK